MKLKLKILKEDKRTLNENRYTGLYQQVGAHPGSLDMFIRNFIEIPIDIEMARRDFIQSNFGPQINALTDADIPPTSKRTASTPLQKVQKGLIHGHTFWWNRIFGPQMAEDIIRYKASSYMQDLKSRLESFNYSTMTGEEFEMLPEEDKAAVYEKHFFEDHIDDFFDQHVKMGSMNTTGYVGNPGVGSGLYGQMSDWWMSTEGADMLRDSIKQQFSTLPQR